MRGLAHRVIEVTATVECYPTTENGHEARYNRLTFLISERCFIQKQFRFWYLACHFLLLGHSPSC
jgi:hypothetical protein